jgi:upstream-binding transcription factor
MQQYLKTMKNGDSDGKLQEPQQPQPVTGEQLYHEKLFASMQKKYKDPKDVEAALRLSWSKLSKQQKEPYIAKAQRKNLDNIRIYEERKKTFEMAKSPPVAVAPSTTNSRVKKMKFEGEPKKPPGTGYQLFTSTYLPTVSHLSANEKFKEMGRRWGELSPDKKDTFNNSAKKQTEKYQADVQSWLKSIPDKEFVAAYIAQKEASKKSKKSRKSTAASPAAKKAKTAAAATQNNTAAKKEVKAAEVKQEEEEADKNGNNSSSDDDSDDESGSGSSSSSDDDSDDSDSASSDSDDEDNEDSDNEDSDSDSEGSSSDGSDSD